jgi:amidohydrolase
LSINQLAKKYKQYVVDLRREFHTWPELSWQEKRTSKRIKEELKKIGIPYTAVAETGVVATIKGKSDKPLVALRADIDALNVNEDNDIEYKSKNEGVMHACGHDGHIAMLLGAAKILNELKHEIDGSVKLIFQPAEEVIQGAKRMLEEGVLENVSAIFGIHLWSNLEIGKVSLEEGPRMATADKFTIKVTGKGCHGSSPHEGVDALVAASAIVMNLQTVVSREINPLEPAVVSIGKFYSGTKYNVIASEAILEGTTRCFNPNIRNDFPKIIERITKDTAESFRAKAELIYEFSTPPTINNPYCSQIAAKAAEKVLNKDAIVRMEKVTGGEDFAIYLEKVPGALIFLGAGNKEKGIVYPHHSEKFNIDEEALEIGTALYAQLAIEYLKSEQHN